MSVVHFANDAGTLGDVGPRFQPRQPEDLPVVGHRQQTSWPTGPDSFEMNASRISAKGVFWHGSRIELCPVASSNQRDDSDARERAL